MSKPVLHTPFLRRSLLLACTGIGAVVVFSAISLTLLPLVMGVGLLVAWILVALLVVWGGIEALAALERWLERDPRFQR
ncbi:MAG: glypican [Cyanobacteriota bacterium]|nr:glypican [Cyanobacteriota bacterium]